MSLHLVHFFRSGEVGPGLVRLPSTKNTFILVESVIVISRFQDPKPFPSNVVETNSTPGWSEGCRWYASTRSSAEMLSSDVSFEIDLVLNNSRLSLMRNLAKEPQDQVFENFERIRA